MWKECKDLQETVVKMRRDLHRIPEVGTDLPMTRAYVCKKLDELGVPYRLFKQDSGLVATIQGGKPGKVIALRADMDALPIHEETGLPFASEHPGCMHACGHDTHMAMLLATAQVLNAHKAEIPGTVKLLFQTGEEIAKGAKIAVAEGALKDPEVDAVFGTHIGSIIGKDIPTGTFIVTPGCSMASFDKYIIKIKGMGCHGSTPEKGIDPILVGSNIVMALQEIVSREIAATRPKVLTVGQFHAGFAYNVIPTEAVIEGTIRALEEEVRLYIARRIKEISQSIATAYKAECEVEMVWGAPPVTNDDEMAALAARAAKKVLGENMVITSVPAPNMGGEDFAYFLAEKPGAFMFLSSANPAKHTDIPHHNPKFDVDEDVMWEGAAVFAAIVEEFLGM
ncbi:MAG: amidohydrolase [Clostridia bacterium]|nr:M20 family metallopeptidase [Candidatus Pelethousia sp.]NCB31149.1 amidohydrolase [Clostridia bacterium]